MLYDCGIDMIFLWSYKTSIPIVNFHSTIIQIEESVSEAQWSEESEVLWIKESESEPESVASETKESESDMFVTNSTALVFSLVESRQTVMGKCR